MVEIFDTWLARTDGGPINFTIDCQYPSFMIRIDIQDHECAEYIFTTLVENQHRWKDVCFRCHDVKFSPRFPGFNLTNMPRLTSLNLDLDHSLHAVVDLTPSPRLRHLLISLDNFDLIVRSRLPHLEAVRINLPSHNRIISPQSNKSVLSCLELLRNAPFLVGVRITTRIVGHLSPLPLDGERIMLPELRELYLAAGEDAHLMSAIIDILTLPSLERLLFFSEVGIEKLLPLFKRSAPPLAHLDMRCENIYEERLIAILRVLPNLQYLKLCYAELSQQFFHELTVPDGVHTCTSATEQIVCPRLSTLYIVLPWLSEADEWLEPLLAMAKSRALILGTFGTVTIYPKFPGDNQRTPIIAEMERAEADGRTVVTADIDNYAEDIRSSRSIKFEPLQGLDDA